jgi:glycosyltransferase involved in cell wall biosynthesis
MALQQGLESLNKIAVFTKYSRKGASSRLRTFQYIPELEYGSIEFKLFSLFDDSYLDALYNNKKVSPWYVLRRYLKRLFELCTVWKYDIIWIEKELFPYFPSVFEQLLAVFGIKYIVDYDDAIFHNYDLSDNYLIRLILSRKIDKVMKYSKYVLAGNSYLADRAIKAGAKHVEIIPTVVDHKKYRLKFEKQSNAKLTIGWIGTPYTQKYLIQLAPILKELHSKHSIKFIFIGASDEIRSHFQDCEVQVDTWSEETEIDSLSNIDIGIMPLPNAPWENGKCGYKLIQYMAVGKAVVGSNVGVNREIIERCNSGFCVDNCNDWLSALDKLITDEVLLDKIKINAIEGIEKYYSLVSQAPKIKKVLLKVFNG